MVINHILAGSFRKTENNETIRRIKMPPKRRKETETIATLLDEKRKFKPSVKFSRRANADKTIYDSAERNYLKFWEKQASETSAAATAAAPADE